MNDPNEGGPHIDRVYIYMLLPFGGYFAKFITAISGFSSEMKEPKLHKMGVFRANYGKKHLI